MVDLHPPAADSSRGLFINDSGMVAGTFRIEQTTRAFRFSDEMGFVDIGVFDPAEDSVAVEPVDMNASGQIVGRALNIDFEKYLITDRVFVWAPETGLVDLRMAIDAGRREVVLDAAVAINDVGEILVNGRVDGEDRSLLLRPIPDCPADLDGSGDVAFPDLLAVLAAWGNEGGPEDLDGSGVVDFGDLLVLLAAWGPCE